jgi:hypothetical protein
MGRGIGKIKHQGSALIGCLRGVSFDNRNGLFCKPWQHILKLQARSNASGPPETSLYGRPAFGGCCLDAVGRGFHSPVIHDIEIRRDICGCTNPEKAVKSKIYGSAGKWVLITVLQKSQVLFPHHGRVVSL